MKTITLRDIPPKLAKEIKSRAKESGLSYNRTVLRMLEEKSEPAPKRSIDYWVERYAGSWAAEEADQFDAALAEMRRIDPEDWK